MLIRVFAPEDAATVSTLIKRCLREINSRDYDATIITGMCEHFSEETILKLAVEREMFVAERNGRALATVSRQGNLVFTMFVDPDCIGHRLGRALMEHVEQLACQEGCTFMETGASISARAFYQRLGYLDIRETMTDHAGLNYILRKALMPMPDDG